MSYNLLINFPLATKYCMINAFSFYLYQSIVKGWRLGIKCKEI